jgi:hypothetical protein
MNYFEKQIKLDPNTQEKVFYFSSANINEGIEYVNVQNISSVELNPYVVAFSEKDINFLHGINNLKSLSIVALPEINISEINTLSTLEHLYLDENNTRIIDFTNMNLTELNIRYNKSVKGIAALNKLENLIISKGIDDFFSLAVFSKLENLKALEIYESKIPYDFSFINENTKLKKLIIGYIKNNFTLNFLEKNKLEILKITNCKKVDIENIEKLKTLEEFSFVDCITISESSIFNKLPKLKSLIVLGKSYFINGDLIELQKKLEYLGIDNKKHYNVKYIDP